MARSKPHSRKEPCANCGSASIFARQCVNIRLHDIIFVASGPHELILKVEDKSEPFTLESLKEDTVETSRLWSDIKTGEGAHVVLRHVDDFISMIASLGRKQKRPRLIQDCLINFRMLCPVPGKSQKYMQDAYVDEWGSQLYPAT
jgi:hypothetical protein